MQKMGFKERDITAIRKLQNFRIKAHMVIKLSDVIKYLYGFGHS
jgi:hypothetical protein